MESNKTIDLCTKISVGLLLIAGLLSLFEIGPVIEPLYQYIPARVHILFVCYVLSTISSIFAVYLIYSILNDKLKHIYIMGLFLLIITLVSNLFLGANVIFLITVIFALIMVTINVISENNEIYNFKNKTFKRVEKSKYLLIINKIKGLNFPKINLSKLNLPKLKLSKLNLFNKNNTISEPQSYKRYSVVRNRNFRRYHS